MAAPVRRKRQWASWRGRSCDNGVVPTFWSNAPRWTLLRAALLALVAFVALDALLDPWLAAVLAVLAVALAVFDATRARRTGARNAKP